MIRALSSFAPTCRASRQVHADHAEWRSGHLPRRDREGHAGHGEAGGRQETHSGKTLAGVGEDLPQTEPIHAPRSCRLCRPLRLWMVEPLPTRKVGEFFVGREENVCDTGTGSCLNVARSVL